MKTVKFPRNKYTETHIKFIIKYYNLEPLYEYSPETDHQLCLIFKDDRCVIIQDSEEDFPSLSWNNYDRYVKNIPAALEWLYPWYDE